MLPPLAAARAPKPVGAAFELLPNRVPLAPNVAPPVDALGDAIPPPNTGGLPKPPPNPPFRFKLN